MSSHTRVRRNPFSKIPFLAAHQSASQNALNLGAPGKKAQRYPAIALGLAAVTLVVGPLTATAAVNSSADAKPAVAASSATKQADTAKAAAPKTETPKTETKAAAKPEVAKSAPKAEAKAASPYASVSMSQVSPTSAQGYQQTFTASADQWANATAIVKASESLGLSPYHATVAVATALQESTLHNLHYGDRDSQGLFQQRPSQGWGTVAEVTNPTYAAKAFLRELPKNLNGKSLAVEAQKVQRSFDGSLYAKWQKQASSMVLTIMHQQ